MLTDHALFASVVDLKSRVFARQWACYDLAVPGRFRLLPADARLAALDRDYVQMRGMFVASPPEFEMLMARRAEADSRSNASLLLDHRDIKAGQHSPQNWHQTGTSSEVTQNVSVRYQETPANSVGRVGLEPTTKGL
jgi:hypothetical protein